MRRLSVGLAIALAGLAGAAAAAPSSLPSSPSAGPQVITDPDWIQTPNGDDFANYFPKLAQMLGIGGRAVAHCGVSTQGQLVNCAIVEETPAGMGFGAAAALSMMSRFRMRPRLVNGIPDGGGAIYIPVRFAPSENDDADNDPGGLKVADVTAALAEPEAVATPKALALARQLMDATNLGERVQAAALKSDDAIRAVAAEMPPSNARQAAVDALVQAQDAEGQTLVLWYATWYARKFSERQLADLVAFFNSPTGLAWTAVEAQAEREGSQHLQDEEERAEADARRQFCQKIPCYTPPPPAAAAAK